MPSHLTRNVNISTATSIKSPVLSVVIKFDIKASLSHARMRKRRTFLRFATENNRMCTNCERSNAACVMPQELIYRCSGRECLIVSPKGDFYHASCNKKCRRCNEDNLPRKANFKDTCSQQRYRRCICAEE